MYRLAHGTFSNNLHLNYLHVVLCTLFSHDYSELVYSGKIRVSSKYIPKYFSNFVISYKYNTKWVLSKPEVHKLWNIYVQNRHNTFPTDPNLSGFLVTLFENIFPCNEP